MSRLGDGLKSAGAGEEWEQLIGGRWLNKIGVAVLVIGMALLLNFALDYMGPGGKVMLGAGVALIMGVGGVWLESRRRYAIIARSLVGGGWALAFFTAYAAHNIAASKVIDDPLLGLLVLFVVAGAMIGHSLRYNSEIATSLAFFLGFLAIDVSPLTPYSLAAVAILAASLVAILRRKEWQALGLFGVIATYTTHLIWTAWTPPPMGATPDQAFWLSQGVLAIYWVLFASCDLRPPLTNDAGPGLGLTRSVWNTLGFFGLSANQVSILFPDQLYVVAGAGALAYLTKSALVRRSGWRVLYLVDGSIAVAGAAAAAMLVLRPLSIATEWLAVMLLIEAAVVLLMGLRLRELTFRVWGYVLVVAALFCGFAFNVLALHGFYELGGFSGAGKQQVLDSLRTLYLDPASQRILRWSTVLPIIASLFMLERAQAAIAREPVDIDERTFALAMGYGAAGLLAALLWQEVPLGCLGLAWLASGMALFELGLWTRHFHRRVQAYLLCASAALAMLLVNLYGAIDLAAADQPSRWIAVLPAVAAGFHIFWRLGRREAQSEATGLENRLQPWSAHVGTGLLAVLMWKELDPLAVALAWGALALTAYEIGGRLALPPVILQSQVLTAAAFLRLFLANFTAMGMAFGLSIRLLTVVPVMALLYYRALAGRRIPGTAARADDWTATVCLYAAAFGLAVLARFELDRAHAVIAWAGLSIICLVLGMTLANRDFRVQSYVLAIAAFLRSWGTNFYLTGSYYGLPERVATSVPVIACLFAAGLLWRSRRAQPAELGADAGLRAYIDGTSPTVMSVLASILLASLLFYTVEGNLLTIAWAVEGLLLLVAGFGLTERTLRLSGLGLLAICLLKVLIIDLRDVETIYRIFSFIVLGAILLGVSFVYTRYRHQLKRYL